MPKIPKKGPRRKSFWHLTVRPTHFSSLLFALLAVLVEFFSLDYYKLGLTEILVDSLTQVQHLRHFFSPNYKLIFEILNMQTQKSNRRFFLRGN